MKVFDVIEIGIQGPQGTEGSDGLSAYQIALLNGFIGTEAEWIASLNGTGTGYVDNLPDFTLIFDNHLI